MLSPVWLVAAVLVAILLTSWVTFTLTRLDRLHARVDAAQAALDAQLVRRAAAVLHLAEMPGTPLESARGAELAQAAHNALAVAPDDRRDVENRLGRGIVQLAAMRDALPPDAVGELGEAATRVQIARRFFNDAVRDTRTLRARRMPRLLHLAGHREMPQYFDIDDTSLFTDSPAEPSPTSAGQ
ncbi:MAG TPA: NUDIX hydrolase [Jatrophihabitans sp.]